eukprot:CAMPEP_0174375670 /NCGR_PEP_ID=MMETSP0811_2-20130205/115470_1 /TAXON_ID=73025 ORGANISM="Eutreptiella gymnastica-like, Strain CCMP1594" /NCGR_SAMPLE_ID=MMETSP0811_2 /ASSEMBLY_ACC=CAM_ASM_000667 /LENGTH=75 /DNA_ID=CAMNT_0015526169 /DNA_START=33 /DNA_END=260 /DNA_ORIENTATION=-
MASIKLPPIVWSLCWAILIVAIGWWIGGICASLYVFISPFAACIPILKDLTELLHKGVQIPYDWGQNCYSGKSLL